MIMPGLNSLLEVRTIMESLTETMQAQTADEDRAIRSNTHRWTFRGDRLVNQQNICSANGEASGAGAKDVCLI